MSIEDCILKYKYLVLLNANKNGWSIYKKNNNIFYLRKKKEKNERFSLEQDISLIHNEPNNLKKIFRKMKNN